jgi:hypothetical protein
LEPKIEHTRKRSPIVTGTRITVTIPRPHLSHGYDLLHDHGKVAFQRLADSYAWLNPHLTLQVTWNGERLIDVAASNPQWRKWLPSYPTSAHWYNTSRFRRCMAAHINNRDDTTIGEFIGEFHGMSRPAQQKLVLAGIGATNDTPLLEVFGRDKVSVAAIKRLLRAVQRHTDPVKPAELGVIGKEHLFALMEAAGGEPGTFKYERRLNESKGVPRVVEFAFGVHRDAIATGGIPPLRRRIITGVNWSPASVGNPFQRLGRDGASLEGILTDIRAGTDRPVIAVLHLACPFVTFTDRGKTDLVVIDDEEDDRNE